MNSYSGVIPVLGQPPMAPWAEVGTVQKMPLGVMQFFSNSYWGGCSAIYLQMPLNTELKVGTALAFDVETSFVASLMPAEANLGKAAALSANAVESSSTPQYGWAVTSGQFPLWSDASIAANTGIGVVAPGQGGALEAGFGFVSCRVTQPATTTITKFNTRTRLNSPIITVNNTDGWFVGLPVTGTGIPALAYITHLFPNGMDVQLSASCTVDGNTSAIGTYNNGDDFWNICTFNNIAMQSASGDVPPPEELTLLTTPVWNDNGDSTGFWDNIVFNLACYCGANRGPAPATYDASSFDYAAPPDPALLLSTTHTIQFPDPIFGTPITPGVGYSRICASVSGDPTGHYVDIERSANITGGEPVPVLDFDFGIQTGTSLPTGISLARAAYASDTRRYWAASGLLTSAGANIACNEWGAYQWGGDFEAQGLWIEPTVSGGALVTQSKNIALWAFLSELDTNMVVPDPKGGSVGCSMYPTAAAANHRANANPLTLPAGPGTVDVIFKPFTGTIGGVSFDFTTTGGSTIQVYARVDTIRKHVWSQYISAGAVTDFTNVSCGIRAVGDTGFYQAWCSFVSADSVETFNAYPCRPSNDVGDSITNWAADYLVDAACFYNMQVYASPTPINPIETAGAAILNVGDTVTTTGGLPVEIDTTTGTFVIDHDALGGTELLSSGGAPLLTTPASEYSGFYPATTALTYKPGASQIYHNGVAQTAGAALSFGADLTIAGSNKSCHIKRIRWFAEGMP